MWEGGEGVGCFAVSLVPVPINVVFNLFHARYRSLSPCALLISHQPLHRVPAPRAPVAIATCLTTRKYASVFHHTGCRTPSRRRDC